MMSNQKPQDEILRKIKLSSALINELLVKNNLGRPQEMTTASLQAFDFTWNR